MDCSETSVSLKRLSKIWKTKCTEAPSTLSHRNLKTQQSPVILYLCLRTTRSGKSHDYRDVIVFEKLRFQNVFRSQGNEKPAFSNSSGLKSVFEKHRFRHGLVLTVGLTVFEKLRFRDGLVRTVGLTEKIKQRFQLSSA